MSIKGKTAGGAAAPLIKNASAAPFIHFDSVPVYGTFAGSIEVELVARALMPKPDGSVVAEAICAAHLRCTEQAALELADGLQKAVAMLRKQRAVPSEGEADKAA